MRGDALRGYPTLFVAKHLAFREHVILIGIFLLEHELRRHGPG
jgi:hypothetical protein